MIFLIFSICYFFKNIMIVSNPARRYSVDTAKHILNFFYCKVAGPHYSSFSILTGRQYSGGNPLTGASNIIGYEKVTIYDQYLALSLK